MAPMAGRVPDGEWADRGDAAWARASGAQDTNPRVVRMLQQIGTGLMNEAVWGVEDQRDRSCANRNTHQQEWVNEVKQGTVAEEYGQKLPAPASGVASQFYITKESGGWAQWAPFFSSSSCHRRTRSGQVSTLLLFLLLIVPEYGLGKWPPFFSASFFGHRPRMTERVNATRMAAATNANSARFAGNPP